MTNPELDKQLQAARIPERAASYWETFPGRVRSRLARRTTAVPTGSAGWPRLAWGLGFALASLTLVLMIGHWPGRREAETAAWLQNEKMLREVLSFFPNRVQAIVQDERGVSLVLSDQPNVPVSTPLWLKICDGRQCRTVVTFSGQAVQIGEEKMTVLSDAQGAVILEGERFLWSSRDPARPGDHLRIEARRLAIPAKGV